MANSVGIVKQLTGVVIAIDAQGNQRTLQVGDEIALGESVHTQGASSSVVVGMNNGKDFTLLGNDTIKIDQSVIQTQSFGDEAFVDASALQQAILAGDDLSALEATAAGGASSSGGVSGTAMLNAGSFDESGHESNVSSDIRSLDAFAQGNIESGDNIGVNTDNSGNSQTRINTDTVAPVITNVVITHQDTDAVADGNANETKVTFKVDDPTAAISVTSNGQTAIITGPDSNGNYTATFPTPLNTNDPISISATDNAGNIG
ncbi:MAG: retention module-containing protein, partial [Campylobacter sp.]|nr:retention module-containing protein [Campylobacter sp.]